MMTVRQVTWFEAKDAARECAARWAESQIDGVWGIPRGGLVPAALVADALGVPMVADPHDCAKVLIIDDLVDSGATLEQYVSNWYADALFRKPNAPPHLAPSAHGLNGWLTFPWEQADGENGPTDGVVRLLQFIGEDVTRDGLRDTPSRVVRALAEMTSGYALDPADVLGTMFDVTCDEMVLVTGIDFVSLCEHHMLPFTGTATVGYLPGERVVGLSKIARLVDLYARRLQVQERMTNQIAHALLEHTGAKGVGVVLSATHACMACRGVRKSGARMVTSAMLGLLRDEPAARAEFLSLADRLI